LFELLDRDKALFDGLNNSVLKYHLVPLLGVSFHPLGSGWDSMLEGSLDPGLFLAAVVPCGHGIASDLYMTAREVSDDALQLALVLVTNARLEVDCFTLTLLCLCSRIDSVPLEEFDELLQSDLGVVHGQREVARLGHFAYSFS